MTARTIPNPRFRKAIFYGLLALLWAVVALALVEVMVRMWERRTLAVNRQLSADPIDLSALRFNDITIPRRKAAGEFRVLSFGDSYAYAIVRPDFTYAGLIASSLTRKVGGRPRVRVVNLGEGATATRDYVSAHAFWNARLQHDAVLFNIYLGNDVTDVAYHSPKRKSPYHLESGFKKSPIPRRYPLRILDYARALYVTRFRMVKSQPPSGIFNQAARHNLTEDVFLDVQRTILENYDPSRLQNLEQGYQAIAELFRYVSAQRRRGIETLVVLSPSQLQSERVLRERVATRYDLDLSHYDLTLPVRVITAIRDRVDPQIEMVDLSPYFVCAADRGEQLYYLTNAHWGPEGNELAARIIADRIATSWFGRPSTAVDPGCDVAGPRRRPAKTRQVEIERLVDRIIDRPAAPDSLYHSR